MFLRARSSPFPAVSTALFTLGFCALLAKPLRAADDHSVDELKQATDRWIDLEARVAKEGNDWRAQKEVMTTSVEVLKKEREELQAKVSANDLAAGLFRTRFESSQLELDAQKKAHAALTEGCLAIERRARALLVRLPDPLQVRLQPMFDKLARSDGDAPVATSERTQLVVGILTAIDQFNNTLTLTHQLRPNGNGEMLDVKVLYWGLAMGYGIDTEGRHAWVLRPGPEGWQWTESPDGAAAIKTLVGVYEKQDKPQFVVLAAGQEGGPQ